MKLILKFLQGYKSTTPVTYYPLDKVMSIVVDNPNKTIVLDETEKSNSMTWGKAQTIAQYDKTGSPYENNMGEGFKIDRGVWGESNLRVKGERFGEYIGGGGEQSVFLDMSNPNKVLKVYSDTYIRDINALKDFNRTFPAGRNTIPFQEPIKLVGYINYIIPKYGTLKYPVYSQNKVTPLGKMSQHIFETSFLPIIKRSLLAKGYTGDNIASKFTNGKRTLVDIKPENMGFSKNGELRFIDVDSY